MTGKSDKVKRCAIYTRKSTEHGLELEFNSLDAQREACEAYIKSQASEGWRVLPARYDDPAYSGELRMTWSFTPVAGGTEVAIVCKNVPAEIRQEDHDAGMRSTLANLAKLLEQ